MGAAPKRSTIYLPAALHRSLRLKAAAADCSISELVSEAVGMSLAEDAEDLEAFEKRSKERRLSFENVIKGLRRRGRAKLTSLRKLGEQAIQRTSPPELANLPEDFLAAARVVHPAPKQPISLRVDADVLKWFKKQGPRYQSRMNAVLRAYMSAVKKGAA